MNRAAALLGLLPLLIAGCGSNAKGDAARHPLSVQVYPPHASVWVYETKAAPIAAALEQDGPLTAFDLPTGHYSYKVTAPGYTTYRGEFSLPQNRELSVWLSER